LAISGAAVYGQGYVVLQSLNAGVLTNTSSFYNQGSGTPVTGKSSTAGTYYYALLFDTSAPSGSSSPTNSGWSVATLFGGGSAGLASSPSFAGGVTAPSTSSGVELNMAQSAYSIELVGWSASLGTTFSQVEAELAANSWTANGFFGYSAVDSLTPGASTGGDPTVFGGAGVPLGSLNLYAITVQKEAEI